MLGWNDNEVEGLKKISTAQVIYNKIFIYNKISSLKVACKFIAIKKVACKCFDSIQPTFHFGISCNGNQSLLINC